MIDLGLTERDWSQEGFYDNDTMDIISFFFLVMNNSGAKFEERCFYISRDNFYLVFYHLSLS